MNKDTALDLPRVTCCNEHATIGTANLECLGVRRGPDIVEHQKHMSTIYKPLQFHFATFNAAGCLDIATQSPVRCAVV